MHRGKRITLMIFISVLMLYLGGCGQVIQELEQEVSDLAKPSEDETEEAKEYSVSFELENAGTFAYDRLSEDEKLWYDSINQMLAYRMDEEVDLSMKAVANGLTEEDIDKVYNAVMMDHPEYFYVEGYEYTKYLNGLGDIVDIEIRGKYTYSLEECEKRQEEIKDAVDEILWLAPSDEADDYEKIRYVYETIIEQTDYDLNAPDNQSIYSVLVGKLSVCQGYAKTTQYLLNELGMECSIVYGKVRDGEAHSWNIVKCNDEYYYLDTTWGDASYSMVGESAAITNTPEISYDYLCITGEQLEKTHEINEVVDLPKCNSLEDNYYVREGKYFYDYDEEQLQTVFDESLEAEDPSITIKCDTEEIYEKFYEELIENQLIFSYLSSEYETISYVEDEEQLTLSFWVTK